MNPFIESQKSGINQEIPTPTTRTGNPIEDFINFKNSFTGDPQAVVNQMIASGQISKQDYDAAAAMARQFQMMMNLK